MRFVYVYLETVETKSQNVPFRVWVLSQSFVKIEMLQLKIKEKTDLEVAE